MNVKIPGRISSQKQNFEGVENVQFNMWVSQSLK